MIQYSTVHFTPLLSTVLHHKTYHYSILVGYNNYIYYTDQQTTRTLGKYTLVYTKPVKYPFLHALTDYSSLGYPEISTVVCKTQWTCTQVITFPAEF